MTGLTELLYASGMGWWVAVAGVAVLFKWLTRIR